uniref:DUF1758 domain-containing protein n=1 Tax=Strongyloides venezuelensis TaxID=75913 RepID=A0A0K0FRX7_STRVS
MNVRFGNGANANLDLLKELQSSIEPLNLSKDGEKLLMKILYIHSIPRGVKSKMDVIYALPDFDDLFETARKMDYKKFQERNKNSCSDSKSSKENDENGSSVFKTYFTYRSKEGIVKIFITFNGMRDIKFEVGVDTCSKVSILTLKDFDRLNDEIKNKLVAEDWIFTKSRHGSHSKVIGFFENFIDIDNVKSVKAKFYVAEGKMSLIGID